jgi:hypothetical protein
MSVKFVATLVEVRFLDGEPGVNDRAEHAAAPLRREIEELRARERQCATMDEAEKVSIVRCLQELGKALGVDRPSPADLLAAVAELRAQEAKLAKDLLDVSCVGITMLYDTHKDDVLSVFTIAELEELTRHTEPLRAQAVEAIYRRGFDAARAANELPAAGAVSAREVIAKLRAEKTELVSDLALIGQGLRRAVLAIAHAAKDPLYAEAYEETSRLLVELGPKVDAAAGGQ